MAAAVDRLRMEVTTLTDTAITLTPMAGESSLVDLGREITTVVINTDDISGGPNDHLNVNRQFDLILKKK
jgi:hypothetical protein